MTGTQIRKLFSLLALPVLIFLTSACVGEPPKPVVVTRVVHQTVEVTPHIVQVVATSTSTPTPTRTPMPTPTLVPKGAPDGDGISTYYEQQRGIDPLVTESFEERAQLPGTIWATMRVSQPYDIENMFAPSLYQEVRVLEEEDGYLVFEVILYPYAKHKVVETPLNQLDYPPQVLPYLEPTRTSDITPEMKEMMKEIVAEAETDVDVVNAVLGYARRSFSVNSEWAKNIPAYGTTMSITASDMFARKQTLWSTTRATLLASLLRAAGIPTRIKFQVYVLCNPPEHEILKPEGYCPGSHPQNEVYLPSVADWVTVDYNLRLNERPANYGDLVMVDTYRDVSEADFSNWVYILDRKWPAVAKDLPPDVHRRTFYDMTYDLYETLDFRKN